MIRLKGSKLYLPPLSRASPDMVKSNASITPLKEEDNKNSYDDDFEEQQ